MVTTISSLFGQWTWSTIGDEELWKNYVDKVAVSFVSPDTGYIACNLYYDDFSYYLQTTDSGKNWNILDTTLIYNVNDFEFKYGWGLSCGSSGEDAAMEFMDRIWDNRNKIKFNEYNDIDQINIVDSNHAVFLGITKDTNYAIGLIEKNDEQIQVVKHNVIGKSKIIKIDFFDVSTGYFLINKSLYIANTLGQKNTTIGSNVGAFDFFSVDTGTYINFSRTLVKTGNRGNSWEMVSEWVGVELDVVSMMNSGQSLYFITNWVGTSPYSRLCYINLNSGYQSYETFYHGRIFPVWDFYFCSKNQGYCASNYGQLISTNNNGGHTRINPSYTTYQDISIFPNPTKNQFTILYPTHLSNAEKHVWIIDLNGRKVKQYTFQSMVVNSTIDISDIETGIYLITVSINHKLFKQKIIKY
jgi:hypothetical protein